MTIIHSQNKLLNDVYPDKFRDRVAKSAIASGIDLIFNDQAPGELEPGSTFVKTDNGKTIKADLVVLLFSTIHPPFY